MNAKRILALMLSLCMTFALATIPAMASDEYVPKTIYLTANPDGTCSLPEGCIVYIGDTLVFPRDEMIYIGDFQIRNSNEIRKTAVGVANDIMVEIDGVRVVHSWADAITLNNAAITDRSNYWVEPGTNIEVAGKFEFFVYSARDAAWTEQYLIEPEVKVLSVNVNNPSGSSEHFHWYDNSCDTICNGCGETREVPDHVYTNDEDYTCNNCGYARIATTPASDFKYSITNGKVTITGVYGVPTGLVIPEKIEGYTVTAIGNSAFSGCSYLTSIKIPDSVTTINNSAFSGCSSLTSITLPDRVTIIGSSAFSNCWLLTSITIPDRVTTIDRAAFYNCSKLTSITIGDKVTSIGASAFSSCESLTSITIPDSVKTIGTSAFYECSSLTSVTIGDSVTSIGASAFSRCSSLTSITIPDSVTTIDIYAFNGCSAFTSITIPDSVTTIGDEAFGFCNALAEIEVDANNKYYSSQDGVLFNKSKTVLIQYPASKTETSYTIPDSVTAISDSAFLGCHSLTSITIPNSVTTIGSSAFSDCSSLASITIPSGVTTIGSGAFSGCSSLKDVYYTGTEIQKQQISIGSYNSCLTNATWHYVQCDENGHTYDNDCDPDCNECGATREVSGHVYDNSYDDTCNSCGYKRSSADVLLMVGETNGMLLHFVLDPSKGITVSDEKGLLKIGEPVVGDSWCAFNITALPNTEGKDTTVYIKTLDGKTVLYSFTVGIEGVPTATLPSFTVENKTAKAGDTFTVAVSTKNNIGIVSLKLKVGYDADVLELVSIEEADFADASFGAITKNPITILWEDVLSDNNTTNGTVALLTFKVKDSVKACDTEITVTYDPEDVYNYGLQNVEFAVENGTISVIEYISGDVNADGEINNKDLGILRRFLNEWDVEIDELAADVNRDGAVNNKDLGILRRYLNDWDVELK